MNRSSLTLLFTAAMFLPLGLVLLFSRPQPSLGNLGGGIISFAITILILRVAARAVLRDVLSSSIKVLFRSFTRIFLSDITEGTIHSEPKIWERDRAAFLVSWLLLSASLASVYYLQAGKLEPLIFPAMLLPFGVYICSQKILSKKLGAIHNMRLYVDGILLQAYFTGARSFLPIAHESEIGGDRKACALVVLYSNLLLFALAATAYFFLGSGLWVDATLLFLMVNTFPLKPMDGAYLWRWGRKTSILLFISSLIAFVYFKGGFAEAVL